MAVGGGGDLGGKWVSQAAADDAGGLAPGSRRSSVSRDFLSNRGAPVATDDFRPGQLRGGWNQLARDLDRAIAISMFSPSQSFIIQRAREHSWAEAKMKGSMEPLPFRLNISKLAKIAGCSRQWLSEAFSTLVKYRVFSTYKENLYLINKDYRLWLSSDGQPRLTDAQVVWCREVARDWVESDEQVEIDVAPMSGFPDSELSTLSGFPDTLSGNPDSEQLSPVGKSRHKCREIPTLVPPPNPPHTPPIDEPPLRERRDTPPVSPPGGNEQGVVGIIDASNLNGSSSRSPEDAALIQRAVAMLRGDIRTEHLGIDLMRHDTLPRCMEIAGWKFLRAAETVLDPSVPDRKRRSWPYFLAVAANLTEADRNPAPSSRSHRNGMPPCPALPPPAASAAPGFRINPPKRKKDS